MNYLLAAACLAGAAFFVFREGPREGPVNGAGAEIRACTGEAVATAQGD